MRAFKRFKIAALAGLAVLSAIVFYAFASTWGKTELYFKIHIDEKLVRLSGFGESPTFAIWLEDPESHEIRTVYVTRRAAEGDWEGKAEVPAALPLWFGVVRNLVSSGYEMPDTDSYSGATPAPGYFTARKKLPPGSRWIIWIEVNLAGDFNEFYPNSDPEESDSDRFLSGQPGIVYRAEGVINEGDTIVPVIHGMSVADNSAGSIVMEPEGITTAGRIFDEIHISVVKPKPRIITRK